MVSKSSALGKKPTRALVAVERVGRPRFVAVGSPIKLDSDGHEVSLPASVKRALGLKIGDPVWLTPVD